MDTNLIDIEEGGYWQEAPETEPAQKVEASSSRAFFVCFLRRSRSSEQGDRPEEYQEVYGLVCSRVQILANPEERALC